jgi:hypothetical protein
LFAIAALPPITATKESATTIINLLFTTISPKEKQVEDIPQPKHFLQKTLLTNSSEYDKRVCH